MKHNQPLPAYPVTDIEIAPFVRKLSAFAPLSDHDVDRISSVLKRTRTISPGRELIHQGQSGQPAYVLTSGWASSFKIQPDGTRQVVDFQIPGDFLGLRSVLLQTADHSIEPITEIRVAEIHMDDLMTSFLSTPHLAAAVHWAMSRDEAVMVEHLVNLGRRSAPERMAHFLLELGTRLSLLGLGRATGFACPLTQYHLADALGLSAVHVNRVLRQLREQRLVTFRSGFVTIHDPERLAELAEFDPGYLDQMRSPAP